MKIKNETIYFFTNKIIYLKINIKNKNGGKIWKLTN